MKFVMVFADRGKMKRKMEEILSFLKGRSEAIIWKDSPVFDEIGSLHRVAFRAAIYPPMVKKEFSVFDDALAEGVVKKLAGS